MRESQRQSYSQVVLVYLHPFRCNLFFCSQKLQKDNKNPILGIQGHSRSSMLISPKSTSPVLAMMSSMSVPICNCFHVKQANRRKKLFRGYPILTPACAGLLERRESRLELLKSTFNGKNFLCRLSWFISSHFGAIHF